MPFFASRSRIAVLVGVAALAVPATTQAKPADVVVVNTPTVKLDPSQNTVKLDEAANAVKLDEAANTVKLDASANTVRLQSNAVRPDAAGLTALITHDTLPSGANVCSSINFSLPAGAPFVLDSVAVDMTGVRSSHDPRAGIRLSRKTDDGTTVNSIDLPIPLDHEAGFGTAAGFGRFGILIEPNPFSAAAPGDIYAVSTCLNRGSATSGSALALLTGTPAG